METEIKGIAMKKFLIGFICAGIMMTTTVGFAATQMNGVYPFPISYIFNGVNEKMSDEYTTLNYKDHVYVPLRFVAETMKGSVTYKGETKSVHINYIDPYETLAQDTSTIKQGDFLLSLHTSKKRFRENETIRIWSTLTYTGNQEIEVEHANPLLRYYIKDDKGNYSEDYTSTNLVKDKLKTNSSYLLNFTKDSINNYNIMINDGAWDPDKHNHLKPGKYVIGVIADYELMGKAEYYHTELEIPVQ